MEIRKNLFATVHALEWNGPTTTDSEMAAVVYLFTTRKDLFEKINTSGMYQLRVGKKDYILSLEFRIQY